MTSFSPNTRSTFSAICVSNGVVRVRTRATIGPRNFVDYRRASAYSQSVAAVFLDRGSCNVIRAFTSLWRGRLAARTFEALRTRLCAQALAASFSSHKGPLRLIQNLVRPLSAGSSILCSLVHDPEKSTRGILETLCLSPVPVLSLATVHAVNLSEDRKHEVPKKCGF